MWTIWSFLHVKYMEFKMWGIYYTYLTMTIHNHTVVGIHYLLLFEVTLFPKQVYWRSSWLWLSFYALGILGPETDYWYIVLPDLEILLYSYYTEVFSDPKLIHILYADWLKLSFLSIVFSFSSPTAHPQSKWFLKSTK